VSSLAKLGADGGTKEARRSDMSQCQFPGFACARRVIVNQEDEENGGETERD